LLCKNINVSKINFVGSCTNKFIAPLGVNTETKIYCAAAKLNASVKLICMTMTSDLKITIIPLINPLVNKYVSANVDDNERLTRKVNKLVSKIKTATSLDEYKTINNPPSIRRGIFSNVAHNKKINHGPLIRTNQKDSRD
jgi:hypothetical protein